MENAHVSKVIDESERLRRAIKGVAAECLELKSSRAAFGETNGEILANLTLAYRHLEDASMRLGKAIQAADGGASVYDKAQVVGA